MQIGLNSQLAPFVFRPSPETLTMWYQRDRMAFVTAVGDRYLVNFSNFVYCSLE